MEVNINNVVIKILQGNVVTQTALGGLTRPIHPPVENFLQCVCQNYENWLAVDNAIAIIIRLSFGPPGRKER